MRLQLTIQRTSVANRLPINYQYELSAWLYRVIETANPVFSQFLHNQGYVLSGKRFKLFTFSSLQVPAYAIDAKNTRLIVQSNEVSLQVGFLVEEAAEHFVTGLFQAQQFSLGDSVSRVDFTVSRVEVLPAPVLAEGVRLRALSPLCVSVSELRHGRMLPQYVSPEDERFTSLLMDNLVNKCVAAPRPAVGWESLSPDADYPLHLRLLSKPKPKLVTIKAGTRQETRVKGYLMDFELHAPKVLVEVGYAAGFGEKNSLGFGCVEVLK